VTKNVDKYFELSPPSLKKWVGTRNGMYVFVKPYSFKSPSAAAAVVLDRNSNGLTEWKVKGEKRTYHDVKQARIATGEAAT
jgi:hypothetical protein